MFQLPVFGRNLIWDGFLFSKWWSGKWMEVCGEGEDDEVGLCGVVWYGMVLFSFFLPFSVSLFCASG